MESVVEFTLRNMLIRCGRMLSSRIAVFSPVLIVGSLVLLGGSYPAAAQEMQALLDRIERLERDIRTLNIQLARGDTSVTLESGEATASGADMGMTGSAIARFDARMTSIENDVRTSTGAMEDLDFRIRTIESQLEKLVSDIEFRLSELEQGRSSMMGQGVSQNGFQNQPTTADQTPAVAPSVGTVTQEVKQSESGVLGTITESELQQISSAAQSGDADAVLQGVAQGETQASVSITNSQGITAETVGEIPVSEALQEAALTPKEKYTNAFGLLRQAKYDDAASALQEFIEEHPDDKLAPNARYWLGETYYVRSEFVRAAEVFFEGYRLAPTASKAPDTLLKLGMALGNLGKKVEACAAFGKLADEFPNASASVRNTLERERLRYGC